jgi:hypothetical protein
MSIRHIFGAATVIAMMTGVACGSAWASHANPVAPVASVALAALPTLDNGLPTIDVRGHRLVQAHWHRRCERRWWHHHWHRHCW